MGQLKVFAEVYRYEDDLAIFTPVTGPVHCERILIGAPIWVRTAPSTSSPPLGSMSGDPTDSTGVASLSRRIRSSKCFRRRAVPCGEDERARAANPNSRRKPIVQWHIRNTGMMPTRENRKNVFASRRLDLRAFPFAMSITDRSLTSACSNSPSWTRKSAIQPSTPTGFNTNALPMTITGNTGRFGPDHPVSRISASTKFRRCFIKLMHLLEHQLVHVSPKCVRSSIDSCPNRQLSTDDFDGSKTVTHVDHHVTCF